MNRIGTYELGRVHHADCLAAMRELPDGCVQCCVTSPPYWGLRKYDVPDLVFGGEADCSHEWTENGPSAQRIRHGEGIDAGKPKSGTNTMLNPGTGSTCLRCAAWRGQLGLEPTPDLYVSHMVGIFCEVRRVLRDDGVLFVNIGDCYASTSTYNAARTSSGEFGRVNADSQPNAGIPPGTKPKDLIGIPWLLAFALRADGWFLRAEIIWHKTAPMPESVRDRPTRAHEQVFLLSKSGTYFYNETEAKEPTNGTAHARGDGVNPKAEAAGEDKIHVRQNASYSGAINRLVSERNWRTVWTIGPESNNAQHYAPFPRELARRCIVAGSKAGDVVLDPFAGTGTTVRVADGLQRKAIGFDLGAGYVAAANERSGVVGAADATVGQQAGLFAGMGSKP